MRHLIALAMCLAFALATAASANAFGFISVPEGVNAVNLSDVIEVLPGAEGKIQLSTAPGEDGIIRRIEVLATQAGTNPAWALFALRNDTDQQMERLLVAPFFRLPGSGVLQPNLGNDRIT